MARRARVDRTPEAKLEIVLQGMKSGNIAETCRRYEVAPNLYYLYGLLPFCKKIRNRGKRGRLHTCIRRQQEPLVLPVRPNGTSARTRLNRWSAPGGHDSSQVSCSSVRPVLPLSRSSSQPFSVKL
jgi:hypothetical protein